MNIVLNLLKFHGVAFGGVAQVCVPQLMDLESDHGLRTIFELTRGLRSFLATTPWLPFVTPPGSVATVRQIVKKQNRT